jgi:hypothetical protein
MSRLVVRLPFIALRRCAPARATEPQDAGTGGEVASTRSPSSSACTAKTFAYVCTAIRVSKPVRGADVTGDNASALSPAMTRHLFTRVDPFQLA